MNANRSRAGRGSVAVACSVVAAAAFAVLPVASAVSPGFKLPHAWLFAMGAVAFLSNLESRLHPAARAIAAVMQAMCVFEVFGFSMGLTVIAYAGSAGWQAAEWCFWLAAWGLVLVGARALMFSAGR